jgi:integrase
MRFETKFYLDQRTNKVTGKKSVKDCPVRFSFNFDGQRFMSTTGLKADEKQWSSDKQQFKSGASNADSKNETLKAIANELEHIYLEAKNEGKTPTQEYIKNVYRKKGEPLTFFEYFNEFTQTAGKVNAWSLSTYQKFTTLKKHLEAFEKAKNVKLNFASVNRDFYQKLFTYFVEIGHRNSTIKKTIKNLNWFLGWCMKSKKIEIPGYKDFEIKDKTQSTQGNPENIIFLKPTEFLKMYEANIPDLRLSRVRDIFSFMCATGLRFSDYDSLTKDSFADGVLKLTTQKTADSLEIPLNSFALEILEKYNYSLPKISNPKLNLYVKDLSKLLEFDRLITKVYIKNGQTVRETSTLSNVITTHCARRTFISLSVFLDMNTEIIMRFSGHHSHKMMEAYTGITDHQKRTEMNRFNSENLKSKLSK